MCARVVYHDSLTSSSCQTGDAGVGDGVNLALGAADLYTHLRVGEEKVTDAA